MIVDDDALLTSALSRAAGEVGLATVVVLDSSRMLDLCVAEHPDLILLDINMPSFDGRDVLKALKKDPRTKNIPVFIHSARTSHHDRISSFELGADEYIEKPFNANLLFRRVVHAIDKARAQLTR